MSLSMRPAVSGDAERLFEWVNALDSLEQKEKVTEPISWPEHADWFARCLSDVGLQLFILEKDGDPVGQLRFQPTCRGLEIDIYVTPAARQSGTAKHALDIALSQNSTRPVIARVKSTNIPSRKLFLAAKFEEIQIEGDMLIFEYHQLVKSV